MAIKIQVCALSKSIVAQQGLVHPHNLGTLLVDRRRVEVRNFHIATWAHGMGQWPRVFRKLD